MLVVPVEEGITSAININISMDHFTENVTAPMDIYGRVKIKDVLGNLLIALRREGVFAGVVRNPINYLLIYSILVIFCYKCFFFEENAFWERILKKYFLLVIVLNLLVELVIMARFIIHSLI